MLMTFVLLKYLQLSYQIVDSMIWLGIRDMINDFRKRKLKLRPVTYLSGSHTSGSDAPHAYIWSPHLVPKPKGLTTFTLSKRDFFYGFCYEKFDQLLEHIIRIGI